MLLNIYFIIGIIFIYWYLFIFLKDVTPDDCERPHTISTVYEKMHKERPALNANTFKSQSTTSQLPIATNSASPFASPGESKPIIVSYSILSKARL